MEQKSIFGVTSCCRKKRKKQNEILKLNTSFNLIKFISCLDRKHFEIQITLFFFLFWERQTHEITKRNFFKQQRKPFSVNVLKENERKSLQIPMTAVVSMTFPFWRNHRLRKTMIFEKAVIFFSHFRSSCSQGFQASMTEVR